MASVKAPPLDPLALAARFETAGTRQGFRVETYGTAGQYPLLALTRRAAGVKPRIYLSAGIHGDEPAPPLALLEVLEAGLLDGRATWFVCPVLNPESLARGTRESAAGIDLNRDYKFLQSPEVRAHTRWLSSQPAFDLALCVHEDWESKGFYLYEVNRGSRPGCAEAMIAAAAAHCPIDLSPVIEEREAVGGIIRFTGDLYAREKWPEAVYLQSHHTDLTYTVETPSSLDLEVRVRTHAAVIAATLEATAGKR